MKLTVHPSVIIWLSILYYLSPNVVFPFLTAAGLHELGHAGMLYFLKKPPVDVYISFSGAKMTTPPLHYREERIAAAAGPAVSLLLWLLFPLFPPFGLYSLLLGLVNLIPISGLDGWRILRCTLLLHFYPEKAERIAAITGLCCSAVMLFLSVCISVKWKLGFWPILLTFAFLFRTLQNEALYQY